MKIYENSILMRSSIITSENQFIYILSISHIFHFPLNKVLNKSFEKLLQST